MRILVVGAGAIGGYFGGRLLEAGRDVTFLVRPRRAAELASTGLTIKSAAGNLTVPAPPTILADELKDHFDLILLSCKAYDLDSAIDSFALAPPRSCHCSNGMRHLDILRRAARRRARRQCYIAARSVKRAVVHLNTDHELSFGSATAPAGPHRRHREQMAGVLFKARARTDLAGDVGEMGFPHPCGRHLPDAGRIGDIVAAPGGRDFMLGLLEEGTVAQANRHPRDISRERSRAALTAAGSSLTASMLRDIERRAPIEADHIVGDLIRRGGEDGRSGDMPLLRLAFAHLKAYEARARA